MADAKTKDTRLVVRLEAEDLDYVRSEGEKLALDASTWLRMMIRKLRLGHIGEHPLQPIVNVAPAFAPPVPHHGDYSATDGEQILGETIDTDDLVASKLREAEAKGLTQPRDAPDDAGMEHEFSDFTGGIMPVGDRKTWNTGKPKDFRPE